MLVGLATGAQLHAGDPNMPHLLDGIAATGADAVRFGCPWDALEPTLGGGYQWKAIDPIIAECEKRSIAVCLGLTERVGVDLYTPPIASRYVAAQAALAQRFQTRVAGYEGPNEPNHVVTGQHATAVNFVDMICKPTYEAIKKVAPAAFVVSGGLGGEKNGADPGTAADYVVGMYAAGVEGYFDALGFHPYSYPLSPLESLAQQTKGWWLMRLAHRTMVAHGDTRPIWITENGCPTGGVDAMPEPLCATDLQLAVQNFSSKPWGGAYFHFTYQDKGVDSNNHGDWMGLVDRTGKPKATFATFKALATAA